MRTATGASMACRAANRALFTVVMLWCATAGMQGCKHDTPGLKELDSASEAIHTGSDSDTESTSDSSGTDSLSLESDSGGIGTTPPGDSDTGADSESVSSMDSSSDIDTSTDSTTDVDSETVQTCADSPCDPNSTCDDSSGRVLCSCKPGWEGNGKKCQDIDECAHDLHMCSHGCVNTPGAFKCSCENGFALNEDGRTCSDVDECALGQHNCAQQCENLNGTFACRCANGYRINENGWACDNINECTENLDNCAQTCTDTQGGFMCSCESGYALNVDGHSCDNIDECAANTNNCAQNCTDTPGGYVCSCNDGYALNDNGYSCDNIDECATNSNNCAQNCTDTPGGYVCGCNDGYQLNTDGSSCDNIDECAAAADNRCFQICNDTQGGYNCSCEPGYQLDSNGYGCNNIDECATNANNCAQTCTDTQGGFMCSCESGYALNDDGHSCDNIDECAANTNNCAQNCTDTPGGYECGCDDGYALNDNGYSCDNIDECAAAADNRCFQICNDTQGGYNCSCEPGYQLDSDGYGCNNIDECATNANNCAQTCTDTQGGFMCSCESGYALNDDGHSCDNIDECAANTNNCAQNCTDTPGGYVCSCNDGYVLNLDGFSCDDIDECASGDHRCEQICENTDGGYTCSCNSYYFLKNDGENCFFYPFESTVMVGRPTDVSITVQAVSATGIEVAVEWGTAPNTYDATTIPQTFNDGLAELVLDGLSPDTGYYYQMKYREPGQAVWESLGEFTFHTQRSWGSPFTFVVQSDSHMTMPSQPGTSSGSDTYGNKFYVDDLYRIALANQAAALPDFQFDLGDTFMLDEIWRWEVPNTCAETEETVRAKYMRQRTFLDDIGHSIPLYLVSGNHENEEYWNIDDYEDVADSLPVQSTNARKRYFMNPIPNDFYSGNLDDTQLEIDDDHLKEDYFAFEWGNALFVALDPFWYTTNKPFTGTMGGELNDEVVGNRWDWTLGQEQYQWLKDTLEYSDATFKFVFAHHNTGGKADYSRGGVMGAPFCEWGGYDPVFGANLLTGDWLFDVERPNFELPVHKLLAENGVTIFFHGHDHIFAREELDGVKYFEVPHPASPRYTDQFRQYNDNPDAIVIDNSGHVQVQVKADSITVDYIRSFLPEDEDTNGCEPGYETFKTCYVNGASYYTEVIDAPPADIKPYATDDNVTVLMNSAANFIDVVANDFDFDGDELMVVGTTQPTHGYVVPIETESPYVMYTPNPDYCDETGAFPDTFHYIVSDGSGRTASATVAITVSCILDDTESDSESPD